MLADVQGVQAGPGQGQVNTGIGGTKIIALIIQGPAPPGAAMPRGPGGPPGGPGGPGSPLPGPGGSTPHGGFVPGPQYSRMPGAVFDRFHIFNESFSFHSKCFQGGGGMGGHGDFGPGGGQQSVQGPLAYLERTTSNIGGGMGAMGAWGGMGMMNR